MIRITSIKRCHINEYDKIYLIVRSTASLERANSSILLKAEHVPDLSPSRALFYNYLDWQKTGCWNTDTFTNEYKPVFEEEIKNNPNASIWLDRITEESKNSKIALLCFCADENLCHRIIIADMLKQRNCEIILDRDTKRGIG